MATDQVVGPCAKCGKNPAEGYASIYTGSAQQWYCHPDTDEETCYTEAQIDLAAQPDILDLPSMDLPGMWDHSDFIGGEGAVWSDRYQRYI